MYPIENLSDLPAVTSLMNDLEQSAARIPAVQQVCTAIQSGVLRGSHGPDESLQGVFNPIEQIALLAWLARRCPTSLSVEVGFGMGLTAMITTAIRDDVGQPFQHVVFDPYGLPEGRGRQAESFLEQHFSQSFVRRRESSQVGLAQLLVNDSFQTTGLILIDGCHLVDAVMTDFYLSDQLLGIGGVIIFDDANSPAIQTVLRCLVANRRDYQFDDLGIANTVVALKIDHDHRPWDHFRPFDVPQRSDWCFEEKVNNGTR